MKYKRYFNAFLAVVGFAIIGWLSFMRPDWLLAFGIFTCLSGYFLVFVCFTPAGSTVLGEREQSLSFMAWFVKLCKAQLTLFLITVAAVVAFLGAGPPFAEGGVSLNFAQKVISDYSRWQWGIFPWGIYGLWGVIIAYVTYVKKGLPYIYQIVRESFPRRFEPMVKTFIEGTTSGATIMVFTLVVTAIILLFTYSFEVVFKVRHFAIPFITFTIVSFFTPLLSFNIGRKLFKRIAAKGGTFIGLYGWLILLMVVILIASCFANAWVIAKHPELYKLQCKQCGNYFANVPMEVRFAALYWGWWLIWTPFAGSYLAKISQGRTLREFIIGLYIVPLLLFIAGWIWGIAPLSNLIDSFQRAFLYFAATLHFSDQAQVLRDAKILFFITLAIMTWVIFIKMVKGFRTSAIFHTGLMPVPDGTRYNRLWIKDGCKIQGMTKFSRKLWLSVIGTVFLHTMAGWYGIQLQVASMGVLVINAVYGGFDFLLYRFFKDRIWIGNKNIPPFE